MTRRLLGILFAALTTTALVGTAAPATAAVQAANFAGTVALSNCSGSLIKLAGAADTDPGLVLSNGHCLESGFPTPGQVITNKTSSRSFTLLNANAGSAGTLRAKKVVYATMTDTDVSLYQLTESYAQIKARTRISPLELASTHPVAGNHIDIVSGYWKRIYSCNIDGFVYQIKEGSWTWKDSIRYTTACKTIGGTSGSPIIDSTSGKVAGVNNTGNEDGARCTENNPCEIAQDGTVTVRKGTNYGQETYRFYGCLKASEIDLQNAACGLPKP